MAKNAPRRIRALKAFGYWPVATANVASVGPVPMSVQHAASADGWSSSVSSAAFTVTPCPPMLPKIIMARAFETGGYSMHEIADYFSVDYCTVSRTVRRLEAGNGSTANVLRK